MIIVKNTNWPYRHKEPKGPSAVLDYWLDWNGWLVPGDSIINAVWTVDSLSGVVVEASSLAGTVATVWLSGGVVGQLARITCRIETDSSPLHRIDARTLLLEINGR